MGSPTELTAWKALTAHQQEMASVDMKSLFAADPQRAEKYTAQAAGWTLDYAKNRANEKNPVVTDGSSKRGGVRKRH